MKVKGVNRKKGYGKMKVKNGYEGKYKVYVLEIKYKKSVGK